MTLIATQPNRWFEYSLHLLGIGALALLLGGFYALVYQPLLRSQADHASRADQIDKLLLAQSTEGAEYRRLRKKLVDMQSSIAELRGQLASEQSETELLAELSSLAQTADLKVLDFQAGTTQNFPTHSTTEVEFRCNGSYASICQFLDAAEKLTKTTKLSKIELESYTNPHSYPIQLTFVLYSGAQSHDTKEE